MTYTYDGDGNRVAKSTGMLYWYGGGSQLLEDSNAFYFFFDGMRVGRYSFSPYWIDHYVLDNLGNARFVYGNKGVWDFSDYYPFGGERAYFSQAGNRFKITQKERDAESGFDNFGGRYYSSAMGRFLSPDWSSSPVPVPFAKLGDPQSLNLYSYVKTTQ